MEPFVRAVNTLEHVDGAGSNIDRVCLTIRRGSVERILKIVLGSNVEFCRYGRAGRQNYDKCSQQSGRLD